MPRPKTRSLVPLFILIFPAFASGHLIPGRVMPFYPRAVVYSHLLREGRLTVAELDQSAFHEVTYVRNGWAGLFALHQRNDGVLVVAPVGQPRVFLLDGPRIQEADPRRGNVHLSLPADARVLKAGRRWRWVRGCAAALADPDYRLNARSFPRGRPGPSGD